MNKYLNDVGLSYLWGKISNLINTKYEKPSGGIPVSDIANVDETPTIGSHNLVESSGITTYMSEAVSLADSMMNTLPLIQGYLHTGTGVYYNSTTDVLTRDFIPSPFDININTGYTIKEVFKFRLNLDGTFEYVSRTGYSQGTRRITVDDDGFYYKLLFYKGDGTGTILPSENFITSISYINANRVKIETNDFHLKMADASNGRYWLLSGTTVDIAPVVFTGDDWRCCDEIQVRKGDVFFLTTVGGGNARAYALTDTERNIITVAGANSYIMNQKIEVQQNGYLFVNCKNTFYNSFYLIKNFSIEGIKLNLEGTVKLMTADNTFSSSILDDSGNIISNVSGFEVKRYTTKPNHYYRVIANVAQNSNKYNRTFVYKFNGTDKVGVVPLANQAYSIHCDVTFPCDGTFNKILVMGLTSTNSVQKVYEITLPVFNEIDVDDNGVSLPKVYPDGRMPMMQSASCVAMIRKWGFIGASYESGGFEFNENGVLKYVMDYEMSYPQILTKYNGCDGYNFSVNGYTAKQWCTETGQHQDGEISWDSYDRAWNNGNSRVATELKQAYVVNLGSNDAATSISVGSLETDVNLTNYSNNADTFSGWICGVIQRVLSVNPKAFFFLCTPRLASHSERRMAISNIIRQIPDFFKNNNVTDRIYLIDQEKYGMDWSAPENIAYYNGNHPTALGHYYLACWFGTYIDNIIKNNMLAFNEVQFVGTNKHYN